jgi:hypothetical protein
VVNEVALNEIMPKALWPPAPVKKYGLRNDQSTTLYMLKLLMRKPENKVDFRDEVWQWKARFDQNASLLLKPNNAFLSIIWEMQLPQLLLMVRY